MTIKKKIYYIADSQTNTYVATKRVGIRGRVLYDHSKESRLGYRIQDLGISCFFVVAPLLFLIAWFARSLLAYALSIMVLAPILIIIGWLILYRAEQLGISGDITNKAKCKGIPWFDPYGLARDAADIPGKKTYYIVDSERNAVVDVLHLGKWGQAYLERRGKRQNGKGGGA